MNALRRLTYAYLSRMYALMYFLSRRPFLIALVRWLPLLALFIGWLRGWPPAALLAVALVAVWINYSLWRARRDNYNRFVPHARPLGDAPAEPPLPPNTRLEVLATGLFSVSGRESRLLLRPAKYWHVPLGDHIIMAEEEPGKYLYQFFSAATLQELREGLLLYGAQPTPALAVSFLARWGPSTPASARSTNWATTMARRPSESPSIWRRPTTIRAGSSARRSSAPRGRPGWRARPSADSPRPPKQAIVGRSWTKRMRFSLSNVGRRPVCALPWRPTR